jgi:hypothetical protein
MNVFSNSVVNQYRDAGSVAQDPYRSFFLAKLTGKTLVSGVWNYNWTEQTFSTSTGLPTDANPCRSGSYSGSVATSPAIEANNTGIEVTDAVYVFMKQKGVVNGQVYYEFQYNPVTSWKTYVRVATTTNGTLATAYENGDTVDGVTLATGDRILIKNQSSGGENGIYVVASSGAPVRASDCNTGASLVGATVYVSEGTVNADTTWACITDASITIGTTATTWVRMWARAQPGAKTGDYTLTDGDQWKLITFSTTATLTVPDPSGTSFQTGWVCDIEARAGTLTINRGTSSTIDGATSITVASKQGLRLFSDGTNWYTQRGMTPITTKGDLLTFDTTTQRLAVGTNGYVLTADSGEATGLKWAAAGSGYTEMQEEGSALTARTKLNFVGSGFTAADDGANTRTNLTLASNLNALAGLTSAADTLPYFTGSGTAGTTTLTSAARSLLDDATTADMLTTLGVNGPQWTKYTFPYTNFTAASTTEQVTLFSLPAKGLIHYCVQKHSTSFAAPGLSYLSVTIGLSGDPARYCPILNVYAAVGTSSAFIPSGSAFIPESFTASTAIVVTGISTGANLNTLTAGSLDVWVLTSTLP